MALCNRVMAPCNRGITIHGDPGTENRSSINNGIFLHLSNAMREDDEKSGEVDEWEYVAMILDRLNLWIYTTVCLIGSLYFFSKVDLRNYGPKNENIANWDPSPTNCTQL